MSLLFKTESQIWKAFFSIAAAISITAAAENSNVGGFQLGYKFDIDHPAVRDDGLVRLAFKGIGGSIGLAQKWSGHDFKVESEVDLGINYLRTRYENSGISYIYLIQVVTSHSVFKYKNSVWSIGIPLIASIDDWYLFSWDDAHLYWLTAYWTGLSIHYDYKTRNGLTFSSRIKSPLAAFTSRPPRYRKDKQEDPGDILLSMPNRNLQPVSVSRYHGIDVEGSCTKQLKRTDLSLNLGYSYRESCLKAPAYTGRLFVGLTQVWRIGK